MKYTVTLDVNDDEADELPQDKQNNEELTKVWKDEMLDDIQGNYGIEIIDVKVEIKNG